MAEIFAMYRKIFPFGSEQTGSTLLTVSQTMKEQAITKFLIPFESYMISLQSILIWEKPYVSAIALLVVNVLFCIVVHYSHRFYSLLSLMCICSFIYKTWIHQVWPQIRVPLTEEDEAEEWTPVHPQVLSVPEISRYVAQVTALTESYYKWLKELRAEKPGMFCMIMLGTLSMLAMLGQIVSGTLLAYIIVMSSLMAPGVIIHVLPRMPEIKWSDFKDFIKLPAAIPASPRRMDSDQELEEFLPETNDPEGQAALNLPFETTDPTPEDNESTLIAEELGLESLIAKELELSAEHLDAEMPEIDQDSGDENDVAAFALPTESTSNEMQFIATHFDSESDSEESFTQGLQFPELKETLQDKKPRASQTSTLSTNVPLVSTLSQTLLETVVSVARLPLQAISSASGRQTDLMQLSDASDTDLADYEIVSESELSQSTDQ